MSKYSNIRNLHDLQVERMRIGEKLEYKKREIGRHYSLLRYAFSFEGLSNYVVSSLREGMSFVEYIFQGYTYVTELITKFRKKDA